VLRLRQSGTLHFIVCGFPRYARKTAHKRSASTMLPQAKSAALRCGTTQLRNSFIFFAIAFRLLTMDDGRWMVHRPSSIFINNVDLTFAALYARIAQFNNGFDYVH
jgi:hypothetical protein